MVVAAVAVGLTALGLALWVVVVIEDVLRLEAENRSFSTRDTSLDYVVGSIVAMAVLCGLIIADVTAMAWLWVRGQWLSLISTVALLGATSVCCGLPGIVASLVSGPWLNTTEIGPALAALHAVDTPQWSKLLLAVGVGLAMLR